MQAPTNEEDIAPPPPSQPRRARPIQMRASVDEEDITPPPPSQPRHACPVQTRALVNEEDITPLPPSQPRHARPVQTQTPINKEDKAPLPAFQPEYQCFSDDLSNRHSFPSQTRYPTPGSDDGRISSPPPACFKGSVTEFVPLHDIPYILLSSDGGPYFSIDEFLASPDRYPNLSTFIPDASHS